MTELKIKDIKNSNLVFLIEKSSDIKNLIDLKLENKIIEKIKKTIKKEKNTKLNFFL
jgi:hypothetical protein